MRTPRTAATLALTLAAAALVACGGDPTPAAGGGSGTPRGPDAKTRKAMLAFARCMRDHGVNMPDPRFDGDGGGMVLQRGPRNDTTPEQTRTAEQACARYRDAIKPPAMSEAQKQEFKKAALEHARCMREHGIDVPDPQFGENGEVTQRLPAGADPNGSRFRAAEKACHGGAGVIGRAP